MPSTSRRQHNLMEAVAHDPKFAERAGIDQSVGKDFVAADKGHEIGKLPEYVTRKAEGGAVKSPKRFVW